MTTDAVSLRDLAARVLTARALAAKWKSALDTERRTFEAEHAPLIGVVAVCAAEQAAAEDELRQAALECYAATGDKAPGPGVAIRMLTRLEYDAAQALGWAIEHELFLTLDRKAFDQFARRRPLDVPFVAFRVEAQCTIGTDLAKALEVTP